MLLEIVRFNMKEIVCTYGGIALVDDEDYGKVKDLHWNDYNHGYPRTFSRKGSGPLTSQCMHNIIFPPKKGFVIDHINGNKLDNRKQNLRYATHNGNSQNRLPHANNTSGFKGVVWHKRDKKFQASIKLNSKRIYLGYFNTAEAAARAYNEAAIKYHGEFASLNKLKDKTDVIIDTGVD